LPHAAPLPTTLPAGSATGRTATPPARDLRVHAPCTACLRRLRPLRYCAASPATGHAATYCAAQRRADQAHARRARPDADDRKPLRAHRRARHAPGAGGPRRRKLADKRGAGEVPLSLDEHDAGHDGQPGRSDRTGTTRWRPGPSLDPRAAAWWNCACSPASPSTKPRRRWRLHPSAVNREWAHASAWLKQQLGHRPDALGPLLDQSAILWPPDDASATRRGESSRLVRTAGARTARPSPLRHEIDRTALPPCRVLLAPALHAIKDRSTHVRRRGMRRYGFLPVKRRSTRSRHRGLPWSDGSLIVVGSDPAAAHRHAASAAQRRLRHQLQRRRQRKPFNLAAIDGCSIPPRACRPACWSRGHTRDADGEENLQIVRVAKDTACLTPPSAAAA
jgi:hypothetical protein